MPARFAGKGSGVKAELHVLIIEEEGVYNATCLEMGLASAGPDLITVRREMVELIEAHLEACEEEGRPQDAFVPAPAAYWRAYFEAIRAGVCRRQRALPEPAPKPSLRSYLDVRSFVCAAR